MTDLQQAKKLLEDKISLTKGNIERKKREFARLQKEAEETNNIIVKLNQDLWKDEFALEAVNEEIIKIPTLSYQLTKTLLLAVIALLTSFCSFSQAHVDFGGGAGFEKTSYVDKYGTINSSLVPVFKISAGYQFGNIVTEAMIQPSITRHVNKSSYLGIKAGYNFHNIIPSVAYLYNHRNSDDVSMNGWVVGYAIKYQVRVNDNGGLYAEAMYANKCVQVTAGFHVMF